MYTYQLLNPTSPLGMGGLEVAFFLLPSIPKGGVYPSLYPSPGTQHEGGRVRRPVSFPLQTDFLTFQIFDIFSDPLVIPYLALLEPTCPILVPNLASKTIGKSMTFGVQETTYVASRQNVKICTTLKRKPCFRVPRTPNKPPKIDQKSVLRVFYVEAFFEHP